MKTKKRKAPARQLSSSPPRHRPARPWAYAAGCFLALCAAMQVYAPSWNGPFLFDDMYLPFNTPNFPSDLRHWVIGLRPLLMFTYWINFQLSGMATASYHFLNIVIHTTAGVLAYLVLRKILELAGVERDRLQLLAIFGGAIFLLHPVQTESVAYVASRSESLSGMLFLAAVTVYLYRGSAAISWKRSLAVLLLAAAALATKEHMLILPAFLLLTDYYWNPGFSWEGARRNWRFYALAVAGGIGGLAFIWKVLTEARSAGFGLKEFTWYQYFFTQCRAIFVYLRLFLFPAGQTVDYDFPISRTIVEHGAIFGLAAILAIVAAVVYFRRRYPLASYGMLAFFLLIAPTSSFVPIRDPIAERRLYLAVLGLTLVALEFLRRWRLPRARLAALLGAVAVACGILTYQRDRVWSDEVSLWTDTVQKSPRKSRPHFQLAYAYYQQGACDQALKEYARTAELQPASYDLLVDWAQAYDCLGRYDEALVKMRQAAGMEKSAHAYSQIGMLYAKQSKWPEALDALQTAEQLDPGYLMTYVYRGDIHMKTGEIALAARDYQQALRLQPQNSLVAEKLAQAQRLLQGGR